MGAANTGSPMGFLTVNATTDAFLDYIILHDTGNFWLADNMEGDTSGVNGEKKVRRVIGGRSRLIGYYKREKGKPGNKSKVQS